MRPDVNLHSIAHEHPVGTRRLGDLYADPSIHADALKVTDSSHGVIYAGRITGGEEDCVDVNNKSRGICVVAESYEPAGLYLATIKGGADDITLCGTVHGHGSTVDIDLGNLSDQSDNLTGPVRLALRHAAGEPITVRILGAEDPVFLNQHEQAYRVTFRLWRPLRPLFLKGGKLLKRLGLPI